MRRSGERRAPAPAARRGVAPAAAHHVVFRPHSGQNFAPALNLVPHFGHSVLGRSEAPHSEQNLPPVVLHAAGGADDHGGGLEVQALGEVLRAQFLARPGRW